MAIGKGGLGRTSRRAMRRARKGSVLATLSKDFKNLKKFVGKTIENKQQVYANTVSGGVLQAGTAIVKTGIVERPSLSLTQGTADGVDRPSAARIGDSVTLLSQRLNMMLTHPKNVLYYSKVRLIVASSVDGSQELTLDDILQFAQEYGIDGTNDGIYTSHYVSKAEKNKRYKIHFDRQYVLGVKDAGDCRPAVMNIKCNIKYGKTGKVIEYDGDTGNASKPTNHNLQIFAVSDRNAGNEPVLSYELKSIYKDA